MDERNQLPPPPPTYPVTADIPPQSPYHRSPAPSSRRNAGILVGLAGTIGATVASALYGTLHSPVLLLTARIGFNITLFNLIPIWQLDGSWILAPVSKWLMVAGYAVLAVGALFFHFLLNPLVIIIAVLGIPSLIERFRSANNPYYTSVPVRARWAMGAAWLALVIFLGVASLQASSLLSTFAH